MPKRIERTKVVLEETDSKDHWSGKGGGSRRSDGLRREDPTSTRPGMGLLREDESEFSYRRGRLSNFDSDAVPRIEEGIDAIYQYVSMKADAIGLRVKRNRGKPPKCRTTANFLTVEEKALYILGRATGVTHGEIRERLCALRESEGRQQPELQSLYRAGVKVLQSHRPIVLAIQSDMLEATEAFSPLVGGAHRFSWRARLLEFYRQRIIATEADPDLETDDREDRVRKLDAAMGPHLRWFDEFVGKKNMMEHFQPPSERAAEQTALMAEVEITREYEAGDLTDSERIERLRVLRHGLTE